MWFTSKLPVIFPVCYVTMTSYADLYIYTYVYSIAVSWMLFASEKVYISNCPGSVMQ